MRKSLKLIYMLTATLVLSHCAYLEFPGVYRPEIPQGNLIDEERLKQVEVGMEPRQVRYLLGTPLLTDTFNKNRWDYLYTLRDANNKETTEHFISILFKNGRVSAIEDRLKTTN